jgi:site-specific DNA recombinase
MGRGMHLAVEPVEAETVRLIFRLYAEGDTRTGTPPLGIKQLVKWLNGRGYRTKAGGKPSASVPRTIF